MAKDYYKTLFIVSAFASFTNSPIKFQKNLVSIHRYIMCARVSVHYYTVTLTNWSIKDDCVLL